MARLSFVTGAALLCAAGITLHLQERRPGPTPFNPADIKLPAGFHLSVFASGVKNARSMALAPDGTLFVGSRSAGSVYALRDTNKDGKVDKAITIASGLNNPNGVAFRNGSLYVAEISRVTRYDDILQKLENPPQPAVITDSLPTDRQHGWKFIRFGPDGKLYVPVGAPCNICERDDNRYASITRMDAGGSNFEVYASGVRNTVGFDWHPQTKALWFTDNGRDMIGDNTPPDELNVAPKPGLHFGFPFCHGGDTPDPEFGARRPCTDFVKPAAKLGPHVAALGMRFYTGTMFPSQYRNQVFIAEHGSWNRSQPLGYRVMLARLEGDEVVSYEVFAEGWLKGIAVKDERATRGAASGRPVDIEVMPDGSILLSDDHGDRIYRITYSR